MSSSKTILLTGATGLIGRALTQRFLEHGHTVIACGRRRAALEALAPGMDGNPSRLVPLEADLVKADIEALVANLGQRDLLPHYLVNNARDVEHLRVDAQGRADRAQWMGEFDLGVAVPAALTSSLAATPDSRLEAVVNVASMYGVVAVNPNLYSDPKRGAPAHYGVVKAALIHLTKELAVRLAPRVRVNAVSFGGFAGRTDEAFQARYRTFAPAGRMLSVDEAFAPVEFLLSDKASAITGHNLVADGGWTLW